MNTQKLKIDDVRNFLKDSGFMLLSNEYKNTDEKLDIEDFFGYKYFTSFSNIKTNIKRNSILSPFDISNKYNIDNIKKWIELNNKDFALVSNVFTGASDKTLYFLCNKCNHIWNTSWEIVKMGCGCSYCIGKRTVYEKSLGYLYPDLIKEWDYENNIKSPFDYMAKSGINVFWICSQCHNRWKARIGHRTYMMSGCPVCYMSGPAKHIYDILERNNICFLTEFSFDDLFGDQDNLRFDFAIFKNNAKNNVKLLIEYDDRQHEEFIPYFHKNIESFRLIQKYDKMKDIYARKNNIPFIRITYKDVTNINKILEEALNLQGKEV